MAQSLKNNLAAGKNGWEECTPGVTMRRGISEQIDEGAADGFDMGQHASLAAGGYL